MLRFEIHSERRSDIACTIKVTVQMIYMMRIWGGGGYKKKRIISQRERGRDGFSVLFLSPGKQNRF